MDNSERERRQVFSFWLRTGRLPAVRAPDGLEVKFNPWHDWVTGRFTFAGAGRRGGGSFGGGGASGNWEPANKRPKAQPPRSAPPQSNSRIVPPRASATSLRRASRPVVRVEALNPAVSPPRKDGPSSPSATAPQQSVGAPAVQRVVRNGYEYRIDQSGRTIEVSGTITLTENPQRSRSSQSRAGGSNRRMTDDGGHYIAARFKGPTDAFNHFAQDANFNRSGYKVMENEWAAATKAGSDVSVDIVPAYEGESRRPATITVRYSINSVRVFVQFSNERQGVKRGK